MLSRDELEAMRQRLIKLPESPQRARFTNDEWLAALDICLLVFLSTIPVIIPFLFIDELRPALRVSNAIAIVMLFMCGYVFRATPDFARGRLASSCSPLEALWWELRWRSVAEPTGCPCGWFLVLAESHP